MDPATHPLLRKILLVFSFSISVILVSGQSSLNYRWYLNANGGMSQLYGDVQNNDNHYSKLSDETEIGYGARLGKYISPVFATHFQFLKADFKGQKNSHDVKFTADLMEYQLGVTVNFINLFFGKNPNRWFNIYGTTGIGMMFYRSESKSLSADSILDYYGYTYDIGLKQDKREQALVFPFGAGIDLKLADRWFLNLESVLRLTNTDKLDAIVSGSKNDAYFYTSVGLTYHFSKKKVKEAKEPPPEIAEVPLEEETVNLIYDIPRNINSYDEFEMKCIIHKGKIIGKGELTQVLPIGFTVVDTVIGTARMEFKNYTLSLYWDEIPTDSVFEVTYLVKLDRIYGNLPLTSMLYFDKTGKEYKFKTNIYVEKIITEEVLIAQDTVRQEEEVVIAVKEEMPEDKEVEFKVQVRATYKAQITLQQLANRYGITEEIKEDYISNWYRYSIGSFDDYNKAKEYRNKVMKENGVMDAFIVAFMNGKRMDSLSELKELAPDFYPLKTKYKENGSMYRIQILALMNRSTTTEVLKEIYNIDREINEEVYNNWRKYTVGNFKSINEARILCQEMIDKGISDAFIVIYKNGERIIFNGYLK